MTNMTKKSKQLIIISAVLSALVILTVVFLYVSTVNSPGQGKNFTVMLIVAILAVLSLAIVIFKRQRRTKYSREFSGKYLAAYENVTDAINNSNLTFFEKKEIADDVTGMIYYAQKEGRNVEDVIGDEKSFVDKVKKSYGYRNGFVFALINGFMYLIMILTLLQFVNFLGHEEAKNFFEAKMGITIIPYMVVLSFLIVPLTKRFLARQKLGKMAMTLALFVGLYIGIHEALHYFNPDVAWIKVYMNDYVGFIKSWWHVLMYAAAIAIGFLLKWMIKRKAIKKL